MQAVIMAGGKGTRLKSITKDEIPKPMVKVLGKPILQWQIECLKKEGIRDIIIVIGHLGNCIQEFFQDGRRFHTNIRYIEEKAPLGTAGAFSLLPPMLTEDQFFLVFGDVLFDIDLTRMLQFHQKNQAKATLFVHPNTHPFDSDLVVCNEKGQITGFVSKNNLRKSWYHNCVNAGFYLIDKNVCEKVPKETKVDLEKQLLTEMIEDGDDVYAYHSSEYIKDIGTVDRIMEGEKDLKSAYIARRSLRQKQKAIFLDRDGTINKKKGLIGKEEQFELEDGAIEAIRKINQSGYLAIVVTNQPAVARGLCQIKDIEEIHKKMETLLGQKGVYLDDIRFCPHHPDKGYPEENPAYKIYCQCRKPSTGMLMDCARQYNIDMENSWIIGDSTVDIQTGKNAGIYTALVLTGDAGKDGKYKAVPDFICKNLRQAVDQILEKENL